MATDRYTEPRNAHIHGHHLDIENIDPQQTKARYRGKCECEGFTCWGYTRGQIQAAHYRHVRRVTGSKAPRLEQLLRDAGMHPDQRRQANEPQDS